MPDDRRRALGERALIGATSLLLVLGMAGALPLAVRAPGALLFVLLTPGLALCRLLRVSPTALRWTLAVAISLSLATIASLVSVYSKLWSPDGIGVGLVATALAAALVDAWLGWRRTGARPDGTPADTAAVSRVADEGDRRRGTGGERVGGPPAGAGE